MDKISSNDGPIVNAAPCSDRKQILCGQKALVTGASSGIGKAIALALGAAGADVMVNFYSDETGALETVDGIRSYGCRAISMRADVSDEDDVKNMFDKLIAEFGTIDILVNNAGIQKDCAFEAMSLKDWKRVIDVNLTGQFLCARSAVKEFIRRGVVKELSCAAGKVINISSVHEIIPWSGHVNYAASKGGVMLLTRSMAQELAPCQIRVNGLCPGAVRTAINRQAWETDEAYDSLMNLIPYKRIGEPEDIGKAAVWLASDESDYVNGISLYVDGGMMLYPGFAEGG